VRAVSATTSGEAVVRGFSDFIIGAQQSGYEGKAFIYYGGTAFDATPDLTLLGSGSEHLMNAANAGDVNADGISDLIGAGRTRVRVWFGGSSPNSVPDLSLECEPSGKCTSDE
jgi:hypothetical protein